MELMVTDVLGLNELNFKIVQFIVISPLSCGCRKGIMSVLILSNVNLCIVGSGWLIVKDPVEITASVCVYDTLGCSLNL